MMNILRSSYLAAAGSIAALPGCAPADAVSEQTESAESELASTGRGLLATDSASYALDQPNVARELAEVGAANVPGVLTSSSSSSPYAHAATLELSTWSGVSTTGNDHLPSSRLFVRIDGAPSTRNGRAAAKVFDAMTGAAETVESGSSVRRSSKDSVVCARNTSQVWCSFGPLDHLQAR